MMDVNMSPTPPKVTRREVCLRTKGPFGLSKDLGPNKHPNILWKEKSKEIKDFMKVEDGGAHRKRYNGGYTKQ